VIHTSPTTALKQTITFAKPANATLAQSPLNLSATATSGLAVTFTTTTPTVCTAGGTNGSTIILLKAGTCTVVANRGGGGAYAAAPAVSRNFNVT
jgi:ribosomal protein S11